MSTDKHVWTIQVVFWLCLDMFHFDSLQYSNLLFLNSLDSSVAQSASAFLPYSLLPTITPGQFHMAPTINIENRNKLGRSYNPGRPLGMNDRQRILQLYEMGHKISHIARIIGVTHSCVSKIMTRYRRTGSMYPRSYTASIGVDCQTSLDALSESIESSSEYSATQSEDGISTDYSVLQLNYHMLVRDDREDKKSTLPDSSNEDTSQTETLCQNTKRGQLVSYQGSKKALKSYSIDRLLA